MERKSSSILGLSSNFNLADFNKQISKIMINDKELYKKCGSVYTYLKELKINNIFTLDHNRSSMYILNAIELYSISNNEFKGKNFDFYKFLYESENFSRTYESKICRLFLKLITLKTDKEKDFQSIKIEDLMHLTKMIYKFFYPKKSNTEIEMLLENFYKSEITNIFVQLMNGKYSNNSFYFIGVLYVMIYELLKDTKGMWLILSVFTTYFLYNSEMISMPFFSIFYSINLKKIEITNLVESVVKEPKNIKILSETLFEMIKDSAIMNRALLQASNLDYQRVYEILKMKYTNKKDIGLLVERLFNHSCFDDELFDSIFKEYKIDNSKKILDYFIKNKIIKIVNEGRENQYYVFHNIWNSLRKLIRNKNVPTRELFILNEDLN